MTNNKYINILDIRFNIINKQKFIKQIQKESNQHINRFIVTANPEIVMEAHKNKNYLKIINNADYIVPDGIGIVKAAKILGYNHMERITGYDTFINLLEFANSNQKKVYFLGAKENVLKKMILRIKKNYSKIKIVGFSNGYFHKTNSILNTIKKMQPDFIFVALGSPKQEAFINDNRKIANAIWIGIGGSFDVLGGAAKRAPKFWIEHNIEWLYRIIKDPKRLKRILNFPYYLLLIYIQKIKKI